MSVGIQPEVEEGYEDQILQPTYSLLGNISELLPALLEAQKEFKPIKRTQTVAVTSDRSYQYATLSDIKEAVDDALLNHGLKVLYIPHYRGDLYLLHARLVHTSAQFIACEYMLDPDASGRKGLHQERGSAITYGMKYTTMCLLGLAPEDDDARRADDGTRRRQEQRSRTQDSQKEKPANGKPIDYRKLATAIADNMLIKPSLLNEITYERYGAGAGIELADWSSKRMKKDWWEDLAMWLKNVQEPVTPEYWLAHMQLYPIKVQEKVRNMLELSDLAEMVDSWDITWDMAAIAQKAKEGSLPTDRQHDVIEACVKATKWGSTSSEDYLKWLVKHIGVGEVQNYAQAEQVVGSLLATVREKGKKVEMPDLESYDERGNKKAEDGNPMEDDPEAEDDIPF